MKFVDSNFDRKTLLFFCLLICMTGSSCLKKQPVHQSEKIKSFYIESPDEINPEAESAYVKARALWRHNSASVSIGEVCSDPEKAIALLDAALLLEPAYADARARRGLARSELGHREEAFDDLTTAIRLHPSADNYSYRGLISIRAGELKAARRDLDYSLELDSSQFRAYNFFGMLSLKMDNMREACSNFKKGCSNGDCAFLEAAQSEKICP